MKYYCEFGKWEKILPKKPLVDRDAYIIQQCRGKDVVHLGACDSPMTLEKGGKRELLHQKLQGECNFLLGFDKDNLTIDILKTKYSISDIVSADLSKIDNQLTAMADVVVCADLIEHIANVGNLMTNCNLLCRDGGVLLISTIHALSFKQAVRAVFGREAVHPEHVSYYSFATLGVILEQYGFKMKECLYYKYPTVSRISGIIFNSLYNIYPQTADGILVKANKVSVNVKK